MMSLLFCLNNQALNKSVQFPLTFAQ